MEYEDKYIKIEYWVGDLCIDKRYSHRLLVSVTGGSVVYDCTIWSTKRKYDKYMWSESLEFFYYSGLKVPKEYQTYSVGIHKYWENVISNLEITNSASKELLKAL